MFASRRAVLLAAALGLTALILARAQPARDEPPSAVLTKPPPAADAPPTAESGATATPAIEAPAAPYSQRAYDPNRTMYGIWDGLGHHPGDSLAALEDTVFYDDKSQAYVILEALKFVNLDVARAGLDTLPIRRFMSRKDNCQDRDSQTIIPLVGLRRVSEFGAWPA